MIEELSWSTLELTAGTDMAAEGVDKETGVAYTGAEVAVDLVRLLIEVPKVAACAAALLGDAAVVAATCSNDQ